MQWYLIRSAELNFASLAFRVTRVIITPRTMSALLGTRVQSAYARSTTNTFNSLDKERPLTSVGGTRSRETSSLSAVNSRRHRAKTAGSGVPSARQSSTRKLRSDEIQSLLRSLDVDDHFLVQVDCLANYQTLVQTIDLRKTPLDCQLLCALQQRENRIVQQNACRDARFRSLIDSLEPSHLPRLLEDDESHNDNRSAVSGRSR